MLGRESAHDQGPPRAGPAGLGQAEQWAGNQEAQRSEYYKSLGWHQGTETLSALENTGLCEFEEGKHPKGVSKCLASLLTPTRGESTSC